MSSLSSADPLVCRYDAKIGTLSKGLTIDRHLADLRECFYDVAALDRMLERGNPIVYSVTVIEPAGGEGDLHYGLGVIHPGMVGDEYFLTKGHLHSRREAAEVYVGLAGEGIMLLEDETTGEARMPRLGPRDIIYVPGHTAHRTINAGEAPLVYLGVYSANAGHDYEAIRMRNFLHVAIKGDAGPRLIRRR